jgi:acylphosphatase
MKRLHVTVSGRVQGVFFRAHTRKIAQSLSLTGWVRNRPDGRVEAIFEGKETDLEVMLAWCKQGPPSAVVTDVAASEDPYTGEFRDFSVRY